MSSSESIHSPGTLSGSGRVSSVRTWIFGLLTITGAGLLLYTWFQPWWVAYIEALDVNAVTIFPHKMIINMGDFPHWVVGAEMPVWFFPVMWVYLGLCMGALVFSLFVSDQDKISLGKFRFSLQKALVGGVGLSYIVFVATCALVISIRAPQFYGAPLQGTIFVHKADYAESYVTTSLQLGYWLAGATGALLVALALFRDQITGKPRRNTK